MIAIAGGVIYLAAYLPRHAPLWFAIVLLVVAAGLQVTNAILLSRLSGQEDVIVGSPVVGRDRPELAGVVGYFVNALALRATSAAVRIRGTYCAVSKGSPASSAAMRSRSLVL